MARTTARSRGRAIAAGGDLLERRLLFVTGKGGVGKTSVAAALAALGARSGRRVLVCEMDAKGSLAAAFDGAELGFQPRLIEPGLWAMAMNTEDSLREYLRLFVRLPLLGKIGPLARTFDFVADAAPGVKEILAVGKLCHEVRERHYDLVVVDAEATGHVVAQIGAPKVIRELVRVGLVREQTEWMLTLLHDPAITGVVVATTPEEMPVSEAIAIAERLPRETGVAVSAFVANRVLTGALDRRQAAVAERLASQLPALVGVGGRGARHVVAADRIIEARRVVGDRHLSRLAETELPVLTVPELFTRSTGRRLVELIADALGSQISAVDDGGAPAGARR